ncbi:uncharacterized protein [Antedon mediterranea]|uniref:uncharacterized protein n=1 Tax=Antedon mediterranea TaxID=105859 RepID=UPI003AF41AB8
MPIDGNRIRVNFCTLEQLCDIPGIGVVRADEILSLRTRLGNISSVIDLSSIKGLSKKPEFDFAPNPRLSPEDFSRMLGSVSSLVDDRNDFGVHSAAQHLGSEGGADRGGSGEKGVVFDRAHLGLGDISSMVRRQGSASSGSAGVSKGAYTIKSALKQEVSPGDGDTRSRKTEQKLKFMSFREFSLSPENQEGGYSSGEEAHVGSAEEYAATLQYKAGEVSACRGGKEFSGNKGYGTPVSKGGYPAPRSDSQRDEVGTGRQWPNMREGNSWGGDRSGNGFHGDGTWDRPEYRPRVERPVPSHMPTRQEADWTSDRFGRWDGYQGSESPYGWPSGRQREGPGRQDWDYSWVVPQPWGRYEEGPVLYQDRRDRGPRAGIRGSRSGGRPRWEPFRSKDVPRSLVYRGKDNWAFFKRRFRAFSEEHHLSPWEMKEALCWCVEGAAADLYTNLVTMDGDISFWDMIHAFDQRFTEDELPEVLQAKLETASQQGTESVGEWADRVLTLTRKAFKPLSNEWIQRHSAMKFCIGCRNTGVGKLVLFENCATMSEALRKYDKFNSLQSLYETKWGKEMTSLPPQARSPSVSTRPTTQSRPLCSMPVQLEEDNDSEVEGDPVVRLVERRPGVENRGFYRPPPRGGAEAQPGGLGKRVMAIEADLAQVKGLLKRVLEIVEGGDRLGGGSGPSPPPQSTTTNWDRCFECNEVGHFKRECPKLARQARQVGEQEDPLNE